MTSLADRLAAAPPGDAASLRAIALADGASADDLKAREAAVSALCDALAASNDAPALRGLLADLRPLFAVAPKAKTAKIVRTVIDSIAKVPGSVALQVRESPPAQCTPCH